MFDKESFQWFLSKSITLYCKSVLPNSSFRVDVMIGITVNDADVATLVCFSESIVRSENELGAQPSNAQIALKGIVKQEEVEESHNSTSGTKDLLNADTKIDHITNSDYEESQETKICMRQNSGRFTESNYPKPDVKQEVLESIGDNGENGHDEDCYVDEPEVEGDMPQNSYSQEAWNEEEWNDPNFLHNKMNPDNLETSQQLNSSQRPNRRGRVQRIKIDQKQTMETYGCGIQPSSSEYNNLMQDICTTMVNQATEFSKRKSGIQGSLPSTSPVTCHICHATLSNTLCLRNHIQGTHLALKLKKCNLCGETFKWPMQLARHKKRVHGGGAYFNIYNA